MVRTERLELTPGSRATLEPASYMGACISISLNLFPECSQPRGSVRGQNGPAADSTRFMLTHQNEVIKVICFQNSQKAQ